MFELGEAGLRLGQPWHGRAVGGFARGWEGRSADREWRDQGPARRGRCTPRARIWNRQKVQDRNYLGQGQRKKEGRWEDLFSFSYLSTSVVKLLSRECLLCPGPGPRPSSPPWARLAMLMCRADLRNTGHTDSKWGAAAQNHLKPNFHETFAFWCKNPPQQHLGIGPVAAVEARYPRARGCWRISSRSPGTSCPYLHDNNVMNMILVCDPASTKWTNRIIKSN